MCDAIACYSNSTRFTGALVDWLELSSPDIIDGCKPPSESQIDFLFGVRRKQGGTSSRSYLLSFVAHQCKWSTVNFVVRKLLSSQDNVNRFI